MKLLLSFILACVLCGCATPYQSDGLLSFSGGFTDTQLEEDVFRVVFKANIYSSPYRTKELALLRAAELTLKNGFNYFAIIDQSNGYDTLSYTRPAEVTTTVNGTGSSYGNVYLNPYGGSYSGVSNTTTTATSTYTPPQTFLVASTPVAGLLFRSFHTKPDGFFSFDAKVVQEALKKKYDVK
jgi:hypothetical protein